MNLLYIIQEPIRDSTRVELNDAKIRFESRKNVHILCNRNDMSATKFEKLVIKLLADYKNDYTAVLQTLCNHHGFYAPQYIEFMPNSWE